MQLIGVKEFIEEFKQPFDKIAKVTKIAKKAIREKGESTKDKELLKEEIDLVIAEWDRKIERGIKVQNDLCQFEIKSNPNAILGVYNKIEEVDYQCDKKDLILENNKTYLERFLYSNKYKIQGYADKIEIKRSTINITDNKVVENIYRTSSFKTDTGFQVKGIKMGEPLDNLDDCNYYHFVLQLSLYMYLAWESNKHLKIGKLFIRHIKMNDRDKKTSDELIEVPYLKKEVMKMLKYKQLNES